MQTLFSSEETESLLQRIDKLSPSSKAQWGKMSVSQVLAHCAVIYHMIIQDEKPQMNFFMKWMMKRFFKSDMVNEKPYKRNLPTAPWFVVKEEKQFELEKTNLINVLMQVHQMPALEFDGREHYALGVLSIYEWRVLFRKHIEHHLNQFAV